MPVLPSYRNQSIGLLCKSIDWFLYEGNTGIWWVNSCLTNVPIWYHLKKKYEKKFAPVYPSYKNKPEAYLEPSRTSTLELFGNNS